MVRLVHLMGGMKNLKVRDLMKTFIVTDDTKRLGEKISGVEIIDSDLFFIDQRFHHRNAKIINLCSSYKYQSAGYYVSLLASARRQKVVPSIESILETSSKYFIKLRSNQLDELIQKSFKSLQTETFELSLYFGKNLAKKYDKLAFELHKYFNVPLARAYFKKKDKWRLQSITPIGLKEVPVSHTELMHQFASEYLEKRQINRKLKTARFDLAILVGQDEAQAPSDAKALKKFAKAAQKLEIDVEFIGKNDFHRLSEFDGLFIRETTEVNHHTFRFAQKAHSLGLAVIDDPMSILKCTNKVYLAELFEKSKLSAPSTQLLYKDHYLDDLDSFIYPAVVKIPDSSFSRGVVKVESRPELEKTLKDMFEKSEIVLAQEFLPTSFDWRIGVLNGKALYACKYYMARSHWQIYNHGKNGKIEDGKSETFALEQAPQEIIDLAVKAVKFIGDGLYGVDIKEYHGKLYIIEINDNPSIDYGVEDLVLGDQLYEKIMLHFRNKMEDTALGKGAT